MISDPAEDAGKLVTSEPAFAKAPKAVEQLQIERELEQEARVHFLRRWVAFVEEQEVHYVWVIRPWRSIMVAQAGEGELPFQLMMEPQVASEQGESAQENCLWPVVLVGLLWQQREMKTPPVIHSVEEA